MKILVVDDHKNTCITLGAILRREGNDVSTEETGQGALKRLADESFDLVITDLKLGDIDGTDILSAAKARSDQTEVVVITAFGSITSAVKAMKLGAYDYLTKPIERNEIRRLLAEIMARRDLPQTGPRRISPDDRNQPEIVGRSPAMMEIARLIKEVSAVDVPVLITGESGTGKELVARSIHSRSARKDKPFLAINCAALPESLQESELFGHAKGAFTGAGESKKGLFEEADGGTLLLDEIGEMGPGTQVKLLRVLQDGEVRQVGSTHSTHVNIRILSSTNQPFSALTDQNRFRRDLLFRINVVRIHLPPLRERTDDLPLLVEHFVSKFSERYQKPVRGVDADAMRLLRHHDWPGNIRELENCLKRSVILCAEPTIRARDLEALDTASGSGQAGGRLDEQEKGLILEALHRHGWNQKRTAVELGIGVTTLWRKIKKYGLTRSESPPA